MSLLHGNVALRRRYYRRMRNAIGAAIGVHVALFAFAPPFVAKRIQVEEGALRLIASEPAARGGTEAEQAHAAKPREATSPVAAPLAEAALSLRAVPAPEHWAPVLEASRPGRWGARGDRVETDAEALEPPVFYAYDAAPRATRSVEPAYPITARERGLEGTVVVNVNVDESGAILRAWIAASSAPEALKSAALDAIYQFEFAPGSQRGIPVPCTVAVPFKFTLNHSR